MAQADVPRGSLGTYHCSTIESHEYICKPDVHALILLNVVFICVWCLVRSSRKLVHSLFYGLHWRI
eukprot:SAG31_NODE_1234_length_9204_cov_9.297748_9_plen_66_part_00